jgi:tetratricopeptide (TPR) repeat protein
MSFLHPEFLGWLLVPTLTLFYFWLTQKPRRALSVREEILEKLRAPRTTMGLRGRNTLFLLSAVLLIIAMAQPALLDETPMRGERLHIVMAIDRGEEGFEQTRSLALSTLYTLLGEEIEVMAFDEKVYGISPRSNDGGILGELIRHLSPSSKRYNLTLLNEKLSQRGDADMVVVITPRLIESDLFLSVSSSSDVKRVHEKLLYLRDANRLKAHIPLFFYPLGLGMVLILFALSSVSKRQSVHVGTVLILFGLSMESGEAGILDFKLLREASHAYEIGAYEKSERLFAQYQLTHDSPQVRYNRANALYKSGRYERARYWYERVYTTDPLLRARVEHNLKESAAKIEERKRLKKGQMKGSVEEDRVSLSQPFKGRAGETKLFEW